MKINKFFILVFISLIFIIPTTEVSAKTYSGTNQNGQSVKINVTSTSVDGRENQTNVKGTKPQVTSNDISTKAINDKIDSIYNAQTKSAANDRAKSITYSFEEYQSNGYVSIVILSDVQNATEAQYANTVTFSTSTGSIVKLSEVLGGKTIDVINKYVNEEIKNNKKYDKTVTITNDSDFYLNNGEIVLVFDAYTLSQNQTSVVRMPVDLSKITSYKLPSNQYYVKDTFNIRMIPLRKTCEGLYYDVAWNGNNKSFTVSDSKTTSTGAVSSNTYTINNRRVRLEYKPDLTNGILYVPISYFTDVLDLSYKIDNNGDVTFYKINL